MIKPSSRRFFVELDPSPNKTESGIILIEEKKFTNTGTVTQVGDGIPHLKVGDRVTSLTHKTITHEDKEYHIVFDNPDKYVYESRSME